ncbi:MAG: hypothetical protein KC983_01690 [Phycisphaerales bacterium]|nr:hypothetical protein [Phycisphaerales bacterium]
MIDAVAGGLILAVGLSVVIAMVSRALKAHRDGEKQMVAAWLADEKLNMVLMEGPDVFPKLHDTSGRYGAPFEDFAFEVVFDNPGDYEPYAVTVLIDWGDGNMQDGYDQIAVDSIIARRFGDDVQLREPAEPIDREARYFPEEQPTTGANSGAASDPTSSR